MSDLTVELPGVGTFVFRHPTIRDLIAIDMEYERIAGDSQSVRVSVLASVIAICKATQLSGPWKDIESLGAEHDGDVAQLLMLYREKEDSFRGKGTKSSEAPGA